MSYACGYIVYGYEFSTTAGVESLQRIEEDENVTDEQYEVLSESFEIPYNGGGDGFGYVGKVIKHVDEVRAYDMSDIVGFQVTPELDTEIDNMVELLPDYVKVHMGERGLYLVWGSS